MTPQETVPDLHVVSRSLRQRRGSVVACCRVGGTECISLPLGLALGSPIFPSGCEGKLGVALESLQGLRDDFTLGVQVTWPVVTPL